MLENAQSVIGVDSTTSKFDALGDVLEDLLELKDLDVETRLSNIEASSSNTELEAILGVSSDYYRNKYFALLKIIASGVDFK